MADKLDTYLQRREGLIDYVTPMLGDRAHAEDLVQEAWLRYSRNEPKEGEPVRHPVGYLYRIVRNMAIDALRKRQREAVSDDSEADLLVMTDTQQALPDQQLIARQRLRALTRAMDELSPLMRRAFDLHRFENKTFTEIADILGVSRTRAYEMVRDAMAHCLKQLSDEGF
ncbi:MAG: sigma-70 family RNA polymerase sigma factor [Asticcacaulis sp.]